MRVLLVEDDEAQRVALVKSLRRSGYVVECAANGTDGHFLGMEADFEAVILDLGLPKMPGLDVLKAWREAGRDFPVLILTARDGWQERVDGLKLGADDYLGKPFREEELLARLEAIIRRRFGLSANTLKLGGLTLSLNEEKVTDANGIVHELTRIEFRLLRYLMLQPDQVISKTELNDHIYEEDRQRDSNVLEVYVNRLRQRLGKNVIVTRRGQGYVMSRDET